MNLEVQSDWLTASQIAALQLPSIPTSERGIRKLATRDCWPCRKRSGLGGGVEYPVSVLPAEARDELARRRLSERALPVPVQPSLPMDLPLASDLKDWQRQAMNARTAILDHVKDMARDCGSILKAEALFAQMAERGQLNPYMQTLVSRANERKGEGRTISAATLRRWRAATSKVETSTVLAPKAAPILDTPEWVFPLLEQFARPTGISVQEALENLADTQPSFDLPSVRHAQRFIASLGANTKNIGRMSSRERKRFRAFVKRSFDDLEPLDVISADGHALKAEVRHPVHGKPFRPEVVTVIDIATRRVISWSCGLAEGAWLVAEALRKAADHGVAAIFYTDNGPGFRNQLLDGTAEGAVIGSSGSRDMVMLTEAQKPEDQDRLIIEDMIDETVLGLLGRIGTTPKKAIAYNAQARGVIERLQSSLWHKAARRLPTYIGPRMSDEARQRIYRKTRMDLKTVGHSKLLIEWESFKAFAQEQVDRYNDTPHDSLPKILDAHTGRRRNRTPNEQWQHFVANGWEPILHPADLLDDLFRPHEVRTVKRGVVEFGGHEYFHRALDANDLDGRKVQVAYDTQDASRVWVKALDGRFLCVAERDAHARPYMPVEVTAQARADRQRAAGRLKRLDVHRQEVLEELNGPKLRVVNAEFSEAQFAARLEALDAKPVLISLPAPGERPDFIDDREYAQWLVGHPDQVTADDREVMRDLLAMRSFRESLQFFGIDGEALERLAAEEAA